MSSCTTHSTPATYVAFYTSANYRTFPIPYALPLIGDFTLNGMYLLLIA